jgi:hypothetical protein
MASLQPPNAAPQHAETPVLTPALAEATQAAWRLGSQLAEADAKAAAAIDTSRPFSSLEDAAERLLPFHVFGCQEADELDLEEAEVGGGELLVSREEQWADMCRRRERDFQRTLDSHAALVRAAAAQRAPQQSGSLRPEEAFLVNSLAREEMRARAEAGRKILAAEAKKRKAEEAAKGDDT